MTLTEQIKQEARRLGFQAVGVSLVAPPVKPSEPPESSPPSNSCDSLAGRLQSWLESRFHGTMSWLERQPERRADPRLVLPGCQSVISVGMNYLTSHQADERNGNGRIARYAWGRDYHRVLLVCLEQLERFLTDLAPESRHRSYVDTGPVMEKAWAERAGIGWIGKHSNLVSPEFGSWLLLGEVLTTMKLDPDDPGTDLCGSCSLCIQACPTGAIPEPYTVNANRCISYLTIEFRGKEEEIPKELATQTGNRIFGCDDCLDICPFNHHASTTDHSAFQPSSLTLAPRLSTLASMTEQEFLSAFAQSPIRRSKYTGFLRNVRIASANSLSPSTTSG